MKRIVLFAFILCFSLLGFAQDYKIEKFTADIYVHAEGYFEVVEKYDIYYSEPKHGIFRNIPLKATISDAGGTNEERRFIISEVKVPDYKFTTTSDWLQKYSDEFEIKIGDKKVYVSGGHQYEIRYRVDNAFLFTDEMVQLYWNVKGGDWDTFFEEITINVHAPEGVVLNSENSYVYTGRRGVSIPSTKYDYQYKNNVFTAQSNITKASGPTEYVTVLVKMPKEAVAQIDYSKPLWQRLIWIPLILAIGGVLRSIWLGYGRDEKAIAVTSYYPPESMDSAMAGYVIDDMADTRDLVSLIPKWANEGLIKVKDISGKGVFAKKDMELIRINDLSAKVPEYESIIFKALFAKGDSVLITSLKDSFYKTMQKAKKDLKTKAEKYYDSEVNKKRGNLGCLVIVVSLVIGFALIVYMDLLSGIGSFLFLFILGIIFTRKKKNHRGNKAYAELLGFRNFIKLAETDRIKALLENDPEYFEKTMSYAVAFNLLKDWTRKFEALNVPPPNWYSSTNNNSMNMRSFSDSFDRNMTSAQNFMTSSPGGSSGGGSSGGGFGGGGGGSW